MFKSTFDSPVIPENNPIINLSITDDASELDHFEILLCHAVT